MAEIETGKEKLQEMTERIGREITELFESGEFSEEEIRSAPLGMIAQLADSLQKMPAERQVETVWEPADNGRMNRIDSLVSETGQNRRALQPTIT